jgi:hypothetical protein
MAYFFLGLFALGMLLLLARWYSQASTHDIAQGARTFVAVFSGLASTGLLFTGRFGLVHVAAGRRRARRDPAGAPPADGQAAPRQRRQQLPGGADQPGQGPAARQGRRPATLTSDAEQPATKMEQAPFNVG